MKEEVVVERTGSWFSSRFTRASWGAIFAGVFVTLVLQIMFAVLGTAIGFAAINPMTQQNPGQGMALASGIWLLVTTLISVWVGACVAGRLSGGPLRTDGMIHGIVAWSVATIVALFLLATATGALLGGMASFVANAVNNSANGQNGQDLAANVQEQVRGAFPQAGNLLPPTGRTQSQVPGKLTELAKDDPELGAALAKLETAGGGNSPPNRDQVLNILVTKHNLDQQQAANLLDQWNQQFLQVRGQTEQKARQVGQEAAHGISTGAFWAFIALLLGLLFAAWGGRAGAASLPPTRVDVTPRPVVT